MRPNTPRTASDSRLYLFYRWARRHPAKAVILVLLTLFGSPALVGCSVGFVAGHFLWR